MYFTASIPIMIGIKKAKDAMPLSLGEDVLDRQ
jgi:hypothetical protein